MRKNHYTILDLFKKWRHIYNCNLSNLAQRDLQKGNLHKETRQYPNCPSFCIMNDNMKYWYNILYNIKSGWILMQIAWQVTIILTQFSSTNKIFIFRNIISILIFQKRTLMPTIRKLCEDWNRFEFNRLLWRLWLININDIGDKIFANIMCW